MKKLISIVMIALLVSSTVFATPVLAEETNSVVSESFLERFKNDAILAWNDEFEGDKVDTTKWEIAKGWGRVEETWGTEEDGNVTVSDGCLKLRAYEKATSEVTNGKANNKTIQSGEVSSKASWQDGLIEVRAKLPKGKGVYPAIWTMGRDYQNNTCLWPWSGEIDIMEAVGGANKDKNNCSTWQTLHTARPFTTPGKNAGTAHVATGVGDYKTSSEVPLNDDFHTFWVYLDGEIMIIGVDEYMMSIKDLNDPNLTCFKDWEQWLILGLQMGGLASTPERTDYSVWEMLIDYVRVYRFENKEDYKNYQVIEAETLEHNCNESVNYNVPCAQNCVVTPASTDLTIYLDDIKAGNYDVIIDYVGTEKTGLYGTYINGVKTGRIDTKREYNAQMKYSRIGSVTLEEDCGFQLHFDFASGTNLYIDKVFLIKTDEKSDIVINKENTITTTDYVEVSTAAELENAFINIKSGGTIKLISDVTMANTITTNIDCTLDLNDYTLSTGALDKAFRMPTQVTVNIKNGKVDVAGKNGTLSTFFQLEELKMKHYLNVEDVDFTVSAKTVKSLFGEYYANATIAVKDCTFDFSLSKNDGTTSLALVSVPNIKGASFTDVSIISSTVIGNNNNTAFEIGNCSYGSSNIKLYDSVFKNCKALFSAPNGSNAKEKVQVFGSSFENLGSLTSEDLVSLIYVDANSVVQDLEGNNISVSNNLTSFKTICNHSYSVATCTAPATCEYCKKSSGESPVGHKSDGGVVTREASCYYSEITKYSCTACGEVLQTKETKPISGHEYTVELLGADTCTSMSYYKYSCKNCEYYYMHANGTDLSGAYTYAGHTVDESTKVEVNTCTNHKGYYYTCSKCGKEDCKYIEHIGTHNIYNSAFTAPDESATGSVTYKCNDCDFNVTKTIKAGEYIVTLDGVKYFTTDGCYYTPYKYDEKFLYYVDTSGNKYTDDECLKLTENITLSTVLDNGQHIHEPDLATKKVTEPTCDKQGYTEYTCLGCKQTYKTDFVPATEKHTVVTDTAVAPTCTETGLTQGSHCSTCSAVLVKQEEVDALGHKNVTTKQGKAPACEETGLTEEISCQRCQTVLQEQIEIPALNHPDVDIIKGTPATCTQNGSSDMHICKVCVKTLIEKIVIPATGHNIVVLEAVAPTCAAVGKTEGLGCENCDYRVIPQAEIEKLPHKTITVGKKTSTYTTKGYTGDKVCSVCKEVIKKGKATAFKKLKAPKISLLTKSGKLSVKYKKITGAKKYEISIKINGKWKKFTTKKLTFTKKLAKGKTYQVKVRAFVTKNNKKYYGRYSKVKKITVK